MTDNAHHTPDRHADRDHPPAAPPGGPRGSGTSGEPDTPPTTPSTHGRVGRRTVSDGLPDDWEIGELIAAGVLDVVAGDPPVPISVWRASGPNDPPGNDAAVSGGLTPRVARILLAVYTDPGDLILDATTDPVVAGAARAGARRYRTLTATERGRREDRRAELILLRWPPATATAHDVGPGPAGRRRLAAGHGSTVNDSTVNEEASGEANDQERQVHDAMASCARSLGPEGHTVVILSPPVAGAYRDHARQVIAASRAAGLGYLQHLVVITSPHTTAAATDDAPYDSEADGTSRPTERDHEVDGPAAATRAHQDLLVFVLRVPGGRG